MSAPAPKAKSLPVGWLLGGALVVGSATGALLAERREAERDLREVQHRVEALTPMGDALRTARGAGGAEPMAPDPEALRGIPPYPGASPRRLVSGGKALGGVRAIAWFSTTDPVEDVVSFYTQAFSRLELGPVSHLYGPSAGYAAWLEGRRGPDASLEEGSLHLVSAIRGGPGETLVLLSASEPERLLDAQPQLPPGVVLPKGASRLLVLDLAEVGAPRETIHASAGGASVGELVSFYEQSFERRGWTLTAKKQEGARATLAARRAGVQQVVALTAAQGGVELLLTNEQADDAAMEAQR